jgi:uncharacterized protein (DUF2062 family)
MAVSVVLGHSVICWQMPHVSDWHFTHWRGMSMATVDSLVISWLIGGVILGLVLGAVTYATTFAAMRLLFRGDARPER